MNTLESVRIPGMSFDIRGQFLLIKQLWIKKIISTCNSTSSGNLSEISSIQMRRPLSISESLILSCSKTKKANASTHKALTLMLLCSFNYCINVTMIPSFFIACTWWILDPLDRLIMIYTISSFASCTNFVSITCSFTSRSHSFGVRQNISMSLPKIPVSSIPKIVDVLCLDGDPDEIIFSSTKPFRISEWSSFY